MKKSHKHKLVIALFTLQFLFLVIFTVAYVNFTNGKTFLDIGLSSAVENGIIMGFSGALIIVFS